MRSKRHIIGRMIGMETTIIEPVKPALEKDIVADILQNDISQTLAAVLLWMQTAMAEEGLSANQHLQLAETNLKTSIKKLVRLHYDLLEQETM